MKQNSPQKEKMILAHDPVPGYRLIFSIIFTISGLYLVYILITTL